MIFNWLFKRFKKQKNKEAVAPIFVDVPTREDLIKNNQNEMIELLDQYKKEYKEKLKERLVFTNISSEDLRKKYLANQDIILKHILNNNCISFNEILADGDAEELLEAKLEYLKLYILNEENNKLYNEIELRYMALMEIKNSTHFVWPIQKKAIMNELDFLQSSLIICKSNSFASNSICRLYLIHMNDINKYINNINEEEKVLLNRRKKLIEFLAYKYINDKYKIAIDSNMSDMGIVTYLSVELNKFLYEHRIDIKVLDEEFDKIKEQEFNKNNKEDLLKKIRELELKFLLLNECHYIISSKLEELYEVKFKILVCDLDNLEEVPIKENDFGLNYYRKLLNNKIIRIIQGDNDIFNNTFKYYEQEAISVALMDIFNFTNGYDIDFEFLHNKNLLQLILSFDKENGFETMLYNRMVNKKQYSAFFEKINFWGFSRAYGLYENVPISTIYEIVYLRNQAIQDGEYKLYCLKRDSEEKQGLFKEYRIPEGIKWIDFSDSSLIDENKIKFVFNNKNFVIPSYVERVWDINSIYPKTIFENYITIIFDDYKNSKLLNNNRLRDLIFRFCKYEQTGETKTEKKVIEIPAPRIHCWDWSEQKKVNERLAKEYPKYHVEYKESFPYKAWCTIDTFIFRNGSETISIHDYELINEGTFNGYMPDLAQGYVFAGHLINKLREKEESLKEKSRNVKSRKKNSFLLI